jgi:hypothetical protein
MKRIIVTACAGAAAAVAATLPLGAQQSQPAPVTDPPTSLANIMATIQFRHLKLAYSGKVMNWPLAGYELDLIQLGFDAATRLHPTVKELSLADLVKQESAPPPCGSPAGDRCQEQRRLCESLRPVDRGVQSLPSIRRRGLCRYSRSDRVAVQQSIVSTDPAEIGGGLRGPGHGAGCNRLSVSLRDEFHPPH